MGEEKDTVIPWIPDQETHWSSDEECLKIKTCSSSDVLWYVEYWLWESTTKQMITIGMPTLADIRNWIKWLEERPDSENIEIKLAIENCNIYLHL